MTKCLWDDDLEDVMSARDELSPADIVRDDPARYGVGQVVVGRGLGQGAAVLLVPKQKRIYIYI
jgi:hypothetical protein